MLTIVSRKKAVSVNFFAVFLLKNPQDVKEKTTIKDAIKISRKLSFFVFWRILYSLRLRAFIDIIYLVFYILCSYFAREAFWAKYGNRIKKKEEAECQSKCCTVHTFRTERTPRTAPPSVCRLRQAPFSPSPYL